VLPVGFGEDPDRRAGSPDGPTRFPRSLLEAVMDVSLAVHELFDSPSFRIASWTDPFVESVGWPADSDETLTFLLPTLGPTAVLMLHRGARYVADGSTHVFAPEEFASTFGVMPSIAAKALARLIRFGMVRVGPSAIEFRTHVAPLPVRWVERLPRYLADAYVELDWRSAAA
jgi:hypothetical protein